jgi:hypothetical protein
LAELGSWPSKTRTRHTLYLVGHLWFRHPPLLCMQQY